jgi:hypothetical protein
MTIIKQLILFYAAYIITTVLPVISTTREDEPEPNEQAHQHKNLFDDPHDESSPAVQQGLGQSPDPSL